MRLLFLKPGRSISLIWLVKLGLVTPSTILAPLSAEPPDCKCSLTCACNFSGGLTSFLGASGFLTSFLGTSGFFTISFFL